MLSDLKEDIGSNTPMMGDFKCMRQRQGNKEDR